VTGEKYLLRAVAPLSPLTNHLSPLTSRGNRLTDPAKQELDPTVLCDDARGCPIGIAGATGRS
jgi:hypothetical protein